MIRDMWIMRFLNAARARLGRARNGCSRFAASAVAETHPEQ
jgi:hypothetical protein